MIAHLRGALHRLDPGEVAIDVQGVGYRVAVPLDLWDELAEGEQRTLWISLYMREDRLELYGFASRSARTLFEEFLKMGGVGPRMGLELMSVPQDMLLAAIAEEDARVLSGVKGIGRKTAEKLLVELRSLHEKKPELFLRAGVTPTRAAYDQDAIAALTALGYDTPTAVRVLKDVTADLKTTEERVAAALRSL